MKLGQYDTFVLDVPHRSVWSVYKYLSRNTAALWLIACQNVGLLQRHCQKIKIITYAKGMGPREGLLPICKKDMGIFLV